MPCNLPLGWGAGKGRVGFGGWWWVGFPFYQKEGDIRMLLGLTCSNRDVGYICICFYNQLKKNNNLFFGGGTRVG